MRLIRMVPLALLALQIQAAEGFDPVKDIAMAVHGGVLSVTVPQGAHLKRRAFKCVPDSQGALNLGLLPPASGEDEAGDPIWRGTVRVPLAGAQLEDPAKLTVTYQPCTEGPEGVCYLPQKRRLSVAASELNPRQ